MNYFKNRSINKINAIDHVAKMNDKYNKEIQYSINNTIEYRGQQTVQCNKNGFDVAIVSIIQMTTEELIMRKKQYGKTAALNFASYKNPGGKFLEGSLAQEESLCHHSTLFNVLSGYDFISEYYKFNRKNLNKGLYTDACLYSPYIIFDNGISCDIITCAAPNIGVGLKYNTITDDEIFSSVVHRCKLVLDVAILNNVKTLILGAFGCGVFKNDPVLIAKTFKYFLYCKNYNSYFKEVIFAIPAGKNYDAFCNVFK